MLAISCTSNRSVQEIDNSLIEHASLLKMQKFDDGIVLCRIANPWNTGETTAQYLLVPTENKLFNEKSEKEFADRYGASKVIRTPLERVTLTSSCHGYLLDQIDASGTISVFCDAEYVTYTAIKDLIAQGKIANGGNSMAPNAETILSHNSDAIWISPFENAANGNIGNLPIHTIYCADYMETSPLGRAEWMKFYGCLVGKGTEADSLFTLVVEKYKSIKESSSLGSNRPSLFADLPYQSTWYVAGGCSTMGIMYNDAGYEYIWANDNHSGSLALSEEIVLSKAHDADIWLFKYYADHEYTKEEFLAMNTYYAQFKAVQEGNVFGCNTMFTDYYDVTPFRPDILLSELQSLDKGTYFHIIK